METFQYDCNIPGAKSQTRFFAFIKAFGFYPREDYVEAIKLGTDMIGHVLKERMWRVHWFGREATTHKAIVKPRW